MTDWTRNEYPVIIAFMCPEGGLPTMWLLPAKGATLSSANVINQEK